VIGLGGLSPGRDPNGEGASHHVSLLQLERCFPV